MSLDLVRKNSNSPFQLQRSIVSQGGEGGAYESGGYTGESSYSDGGVAAAIAGVGQMLGATISSRTAADDNASNISKKERLDKRTSRLTEKMLKTNDPKQAARIETRLGNIGEKKQKAESEINAYNEATKPTLKSDIVGKTTPVIVNAKVSPAPTKEEGLDSPWLSSFNPAKATSEKLFGSRLKK